MSLLSHAAYAVMRLLQLSYRFEYHGQQHLAACKGAFIFATWHQNLFAGILAQSDRRHVVMISRSRHADALSDACTRLGHLVVRGSSGKGGVDKGGGRASTQMMRALRQGIPGAITVDGPRGPARQAKPGVIDIAAKTQVPIIPYAAIASRYWTFKTWDAFRLPKPFARIRVYCGAPLQVPADIGAEALLGLQQQLSLRITALTPDPLPAAA